MAAGWFLYYQSNTGRALTETNQQVDNTQVTNTETSNSDGHIFQTGSEVLAPQQSTAQPTSQELSTTSTTMDDTRTMAGTPAEAAIVRQWLLLRGQYRQEDLHDYLSYDWDTLSKLADSGDVKAMRALAKMSITRPYPPQGGGAKYAELMHRAAVYGSSSALPVIGTKTPDELSGPDGRKHLIESLAWKNTAAMRGDIFALGSALEDLRNQNQTLSHSDVAAIRARSKEIYEELSKERAALGLGPFDNSVPKEVEQYNENIKRDFKDGFKLMEVN